jgi:hypothetical protein
MTEPSCPPPPPGMPASRTGLHGPETKFFRGLRARLSSLEQVPLPSVQKNLRGGLLVSLVLAAVVGFLLSYFVQLALIPLGTVTIVARARHCTNFRNGRYVFGAFSVSRWNGICVKFRAFVVDAKESSKTFDHGVDVRSASVQTRGLIHKSLDRHLCFVFGQISQLVWIEFQPLAESPKLVKVDFFRAFASTKPAKVVQKVLHTLVFALPGLSAFS